MKIRRIILSVICFTLLAAFTISKNDVAVAQTEAKQEKQLINQESADLMMRRIRSEELYQSLLSSFGNRESLGVNDYPEYYGGSYTNPDGQLVVLVVEGHDGLARQAMSSIGKASSVDYVIEEVKYSYRQLTEAMNTINEVMSADSKPQVFAQIASIKLLDDRNHIMVELLDDSPEITKRFKDEVLDVPFITFSQVGGRPVELSTITPGSRIESFSAAGSMAYRAKSNGIEGIVTAGHVAPYIDTLRNEMRYQGSVFARTTKTNNSGSVDAAFTSRSNPNFQYSNSVGGGTLSTLSVNPNLHSTVYKRGQVTGITQGTISSTNVSTVIGGVYFQNLTSIRMSVAPRSGDSGALVYNIASESSIRNTVGILKGAYFNEAYFTKATSVNQMFGLSRY